MNNGVAPLRLAKSTDAPFFRSSAAILVCPFSAARNKSVAPWRSAKSTDAPLSKSARTSLIRPSVIAIRNATAGLTGARLIFATFFSWCAAGFSIAGIFLVGWSTVEESRDVGKVLDDRRFRTGGVAGSLSAFDGAGCFGWDEEADDG